MPEKEPSAGNQNEWERMTPEEQTVLEEALKKEKPSTNREQTPEEVQFAELLQKMSEEADLQEPLEIRQKKAAEKIDGIIPDIEKDIQAIDDNETLRNSTEIQEIKQGLEAVLTKLKENKRGMENMADEEEIPKEMLIELSIGDSEENIKEYEMLASKLDRYLNGELLTQEQIDEKLNKGLTELTAEQRGRAAKLSEEAFDEYQTKLNEGASPERAKEEATGKILLEMDNRVRFEALNEFNKKIEGETESKTEKGLEETEVAVSKKITPELVRDVALKAQEVFREAIDSGLSQAEAVAKSREKLRELTQDTPGLIEKVTRQLNISKRESLAKTAPPPENLITMESIGPETGVMGAGEILEKEIPPSPVSEETEKKRNAQEQEAYRLHEEQTMGGGVEKEPETVAGPASEETAKEEAEKPALVETEELTLEEVKRFEKETEPQTAQEEKLVEETKKEILALPKPEREKLGAGFWGINFTVKERAARTVADIAKSVGGKLDQKGTVGRFVASLGESYNNEAEDAKKKLEQIVQERTLGKVADQRYLISSILKYGRTAFDFLGLTAASPLRFWTMGAMVVGRGADILKEARLKNEEVIEKTRLKDIDAAAKEAWKIYNEAKLKSGEKDPTSAELSDAYKKNLPDDLLKRLNGNPEPQVAEKIIQKVFRWHIEKSTANLQEKVAAIENNQELSAQEKNAQKETIFNKYGKKLKDYDRMLSQYGEVDAWAMAAKYAETTSKAVVYGVMAESLYLGLSKIWENLAGVLDERPEIIPGKGFNVADFEKQIGIDSQDGISESEAKVLAEAITRSKASGLLMAEEIQRRYGGIVTQDTKKPISEIFAEKEKVIPKIEESPKPLVEEVKTTPETPAAPETTTLKFDRPLEDIIDSERVGTGSDSVWKSTKEIFLYRSEADLKKLGFDVSNKDPEFGEKLDKWAETQTANLVKEWTDAHGGQSPDVVHNGDKIRLEFDTANEPHLKILNAEGKEIEPSSFAPAELEPHPELPEAPAEVAPSPSAPVETAPTAPPPSAETLAAEVPPVDKFKKSWEKTNEIYGVQREEERAKIVGNYIEKIMTVTEYKGNKIWGEKLNTFAHMFPMEGMGFAEKIEDIATPEKLAETIAKFEKQITDTTRALLKDDLRGMDTHNEPFPIISADGERIFFAAPRGDNKWGILKYNQSGTDFEFIGNPSKLFWRRLFSVKDIKKLLGY